MYVCKSHTAAIKQIFNLFKLRFLFAIKIHLKIPHNEVVIFAAITAHIGMSDTCNISKNNLKVYFFIYVN